MQILTHATQLTVPVTQPSVSVQQPFIPITRLSLPVTQPLVRVTQSQVPRTQSSVPVTQLPLPVAQPLVPVMQSSVPVTQSSVPATQSSLPVEQPSVPAMQSSVPVMQPYLIMWFTDSVTQASVSEAYPFSSGLESSTTVSVFSLRLTDTSFCNQPVNTCCTPLAFNHTQSAVSFNIFSNGSVSTLKVVIELLVKFEYSKNPKLPSNCDRSRHNWCVLFCSLTYHSQGELSIWDFVPSKPLWKLSTLRYTSAITNQSCLRNAVTG